MTQDDPKRPPRERVFAIIEQATGRIEEKVRRLAEEFPQADTRYLAEIFADRDKELTAKADKLERECRATAAVLKYLDATGYDCLADACEDCGYEPEELWAEIMEDAGLPGQEMPETIQVGWEH